MYTSYHWKIKVIDDSDPIEPVVIGPPIQKLSLLPPTEPGTRTLSNSLPATHKTESCHSLLPCIRLSVPRRNS